MPKPPGNRVAGIVLALVTTACSTLPVRCAADQQAAVQEWVYFGADKPGGQVTPQQWSDFLASTVTPRFPAGLTTWQASGQWRSASGALVHEPSYVLGLVHPPDPEREAAVGEIVEAYKHRFEQESVLRVRSSVCMSL